MGHTPRGVFTAQVPGEGRGSPCPTSALGTTRLSLLHLFTFLGEISFEERHLNLWLRKVWKPLL